VLTTFIAVLSLSLDFNVAQTFRVKLLSGSLHSSLQASAKCCFSTSYDLCCAGFALLSFRIAGELTPSNFGHFRPGTTRVSFTVRPRWSNSEALILSRIIITNLTKTFLAVAVFATPLGFFLANLL
jgi:hypothetical protein